jgi:LysM repeat protein
MRWRMIALVSLGVNLVLAAVWLSSSHSQGSGGLTGLSQASAIQAKTNLVVRRLPFAWREIESADYPTYIANLRFIGCPEQTIRDIIIADVNALYAVKRATNVVTANQQWWRSEPDRGVVLAAAVKGRELDDERRALLTRLLGSNWESGDLVNLPRPSRQGVVLDGPVLGNLPAEAKQAIQEVSQRSEERLQNYLNDVQSEGASPDPVELAGLRQQTREELQRVLSPTQLEEFLLRYSQNATNLRADFGQLRFFNPTPDEFRAVFRATDSLDQQIELLAGGDDPNTVAQRKALGEQRENMLKLALGPKRYEEYRLLQDPLYRQAFAAAQQAGTPEAARTIYEVNVAAAAEQDRINSDTNLTAQQKLIELKRIELEQLKANSLAAGQELPPPEPIAPQAPQKKFHVIRQGDTLPVIALLYGLPVSAIRSANPKVNFSKIKPGDAIEIPVAAPPPSSVP